MAYGPKPEALAALAERYPGLDGLDDLVAEAPGDVWYVLIEKNVGGAEPPFWASGHTTWAGMESYVNDQEYPHDWDPEAVLVVSARTLIGVLVSRRITHGPVLEVL